MLREYIDEVTFEKETIDISDDLIEISENLHETFGNFGPVVIRNDKKSLCFAINNTKLKNHNRIGNNDDIYRITIEKL